MHRHRHRLSLIALTTSLVGAACTDAPSPIDVGSRSRSSAALRGYESCDELATDLRRHTGERARTMLLQQREQLRNGGGYWLGGVDAGAPEAADDGANADGGRQEGVDFSGTNNQEQGVDEADIVKTDGYFIYTLNGDRLEIMGVPEFGQLTAVSSTAIEGWPTQMLLSDDRAVVFSQIYVWETERTGDLGDLLFNDDGSPHGESLVKLTVLDLGEDRASPRVERELYLEGHVLSGRRIDDVIRLASYAWFDVPGLRTWLDVPYEFWDALVPESVRHAEIDRAYERALAENERILAGTDVSHFVPRLFERQGGRIVERGLRRDACRNVSIPEDGVAFGFTSLLTLGLGDEVSVEADHVVSNYPILYSSTDTLLLAEPAQDWWWYWGNEEFNEATNIHRFRLDGATTTYTGSGRVDGTLLGQFALDAHDDVVRVAATVGRFNRWWTENPAPETSHLTTLGGDNSLEVLGSVSGIAPGERLWSVRFTDDEAYLVTFRNIDPLWTVDLKDVRQPRILGELHVPGVSTYIHPLGDSLLTIGLAGTDEGLEWGVTQLSLFDIADRANPTLASSLRLSPGHTDDGWQYGYSEATWEHKAFSYWGPQSAVAIPLSTWRWDDQGGYEYKSELVLARAEAGAALEVIGTVDHADFYNRDPNAWWDYRDIRRSYFMGDFIYAVSDKGVSCHRLGTLERTAAVDLQGSFRQ